MTLVSRFAPHAILLRTALTGMLLLGAACEAPMDPTDDAAPVRGTERAAAGSAAAAAATAATVDSHSYARPDEARVTHMSIAWQVDFDNRRLDGTVELELERADASGVGVLMLDSRDLDIRRVEALVGEDWLETAWELGEADAVMGQSIEVALPAGSEQVRLAYATRPQATGLQWLAPEQTAGGRHPFLFSQAQAIHARSMVPCQDSPAVRVTFDATLKVPPPLTAVMAAVRVEGETPTPGEFRYEMPYPIPSYLIAVAAGDIAFGAIGPRSGVWAEPELLQPALHEFADLEKMIDATEALYGPYRWRRYDLLVLPPAFPFGGMENPLLTFLTPTILAGDRSLVSLIAHELAHSWSGNLVTNATWSDFWLNEGFTSYIEKRIMEAVYGPERAEMEWVLSRQDLDADLQTLAETPADQQLHLDLAGRNPDDGMTAIAYDKGAHFLRRLEEAYGRQAFDTFLRRWFDDHAFTSVTTGQFLADLDRHLIAAGQPVAGSDRPDVQAWVRGSGLPDDVPAFTSRALAVADVELKRWLAGEAEASRLQVEGWNTQQWLHFVRGLPEDLAAPRLAQLDEAFALTASGNSEVLTAWMEKAILCGYDGVEDRLQAFLTTVGRRKFLQPLYEALMETPAGQAKARTIYGQARPRYHAIAVRTLDGVVGWNGQS